jgi:alpha-1,3-glucosyltransferase
MRLTTLLVELIFLFPPIILLAYKSRQIYSKIFLLAILIKPDIILIDHGHFQYNSLILGLILLGFYFLL